MGETIPYPLVTMAVGYFASFWFTVELTMRFYRYAYLARGEGCDCGDLDFFVVSGTAYGTLPCEKQAAMPRQETQNEERPAPSRASPDGTASTVA